MRKILVLRGGALGDFLVTLPALAALRQRWPQARIECVGNATAGALAVARGLLDAMHSQHEARWQCLYSESPLPAPVTAWLGAFDLVLNFWPDPDDDLRRHLPVRSGQVFLGAPAMPQRAPAAAHYCAPLRPLGIEVTSFSYALRPMPGERGADASASIALHPGSGSPRKNWPLENWTALIQRLPARTAILLGEAEASFAPPTRTDHPTNLFIQRPLEEVVSLLSTCRLFVGHDSGISHLAAACGARCVLIFGPSDPAMWAPPAPNVRVLHRANDLAQLAVDDVHAAVVAALADQR